jgi:hypothetical protein
MAGKIIADIIEAPYNKVSLNVGNVTVASINASGVYSNTGNLLITNTGSIGSAAIAANAITQTAIASGVAGTGPAFSAYRNGTQGALTSGTFTKVQLNAEEFDTANCFDSTTNYRFTPNVSGYYQINGGVSPSAFSGAFFLAGIYKNGSLYKNGSNFPTNSAAGPTSTVSSLVYLNGTTDYVELYVIANGTPTLNGSQVADTYFNGALVRAA